MSKQILSNQWACECSTMNSLRKRRCACCGRKMPDDFLNKIYKEEISIQNLFFRRLRRNKEISRCEKTGQLLAKHQTVAMVLAIVILVACNGLRFYFFPEAISTLTDDYIMSREDRFTNELPDFTYKFTGFKQVPGTIEYVWTSIWSSFEDVSKGLSEDRNQKHLNKDKINHIEEK